MTLLGCCPYCSLGLMGMRQNRMHADTQWLAHSPWRRAHLLTRSVASSEGCLSTVSEGHTCLHSLSLGFVLHHLNSPESFTIQICGGWFCFVLPFFVSPRALSSTSSHSSTELHPCPGNRPIQLRCPSQECVVPNYQLTTSTCAHLLPLLSFPAQWSKPWPIKNPHAGEKNFQIFQKA